MDRDWSQPPSGNWYANKSARTFSRRRRGSRMQHDIRTDVAKEKTDQSARNASVVIPHRVGEIEVVDGELSKIPMHRRRRIYLSDSEDDLMSESWQQRKSYEESKSESSFEYGDNAYHEPLIDDELFQLSGSDDSEKEEMNIKVDLSLTAEDHMKHAESHSVLIYFPDGRASSTEVKQWLTSTFGNAGKLGIRYCLSKGNGFFTAFFEKSAARKKALSFKPYEHCNTSVHVFPWISQVDEHGNLCSPKTICFPGLPDQLLSDLPAIGKAFGAFVSCLGVIDSTAAKLRKRRVHEDPFVNLRVPNFKVSLPNDCSDPSVVALFPNRYKVPSSVEIKISKEVTVKQPIFELKSFPSCSAKKNSKKSTGDQCVTCYKYLQEQRVMLFPCGHTNLCRGCALRIWDTSKRCPNCRIRIQKKPFRFWI